MRADPEMEQLYKFQVYVDTGNGFSEEQSFFMPNVYRGRSRVSVRIPFGKEVRALRLDPALVPCMLYGVKLCVNGRCVYEQTTGLKGASAATDCAISTNGVQAAGGAMVFTTNDPNLTVNISSMELSGENELTMEAGIIFLTDEAAKSLYPEVPASVQQQEREKRKAFWKR